MADARQKMKDEIEIFKGQYDDAVELIPMLEAESASIANQVTFLQSELQILEQQLIRRAEENVEERHKADQWKQIAKTLGTICAFIPYPPVQAVGVALNLAANYDPNKPWDTIQQLPNVVNTFNNQSEEIKKAADEWKTALDGANIGNLEKLGRDEYFNKLKKLGEVAAPLGKALYDGRVVFNQTEVPDSEINAELQRLKAESPEFEALINKIKGLMIQKELFAQNLASTMQTISTLSDNIMHNLLGIDGLNRAVTEGSSVLDQSALMYLKEMDRRARERLLKYHYYMAKAYEYRMLKPYTGELNLNSLLDKCIAIAEQSCIAGTCTY